MLKWAVNGKKNSEQEKDEPEAEPTEALVRSSRHSLEGGTVKRSRKPNRYQRRSFGGTTHKNHHIRIVDKENFNFIGSTPNYYKEGLLNKKSEVTTAFKDVSNVTPTTLTPSKKLQSLAETESASNVHRKSFDKYPTNLPPTPPTYSRKIREAKKRKLEMTRRSNESVAQFGIPSFESLNHVDECLTGMKTTVKTQSKAITCDETMNHNSKLISENPKYFKNTNRKKYVQSIAPTVEIEYSPHTLINCHEIPLKQGQTTVPIFGSAVFMDALYFRNELKRKKSNDFETSFKSPSAGKKDVHDIIRTSLSPLSMTPLSRKLSSLRFSNIGSCQGRRKSFTNISDNSGTKFINPLTISLVKDDETSTEMETKYLIPNFSSHAESTISDSHIGDKTLEKMIEEIIKSTKKVKNKRKILKIQQDHYKHEIQKLTNNDPILDEKTEGEVFFEPQGRSLVIKEAKHVNLSRENSLSPRSTPTKSREQKLSKLGINPDLVNKSFILDDGKYEREVRTPDVFSTKFGSMIDIRELEKLPGYRLKRQKCVRRKKSNISIESTKQKLKESILTLEKGIPSPISSQDQTQKPIVPLSESFNCVVGIPIGEEDNLSLQFENSLCKTTSSPKLSENNVSSKTENTASKVMFGLTLENGIPSPITPISNLKRPRSIISADDYSFRSSKLRLDEECNPVPTPSDEINNSRRCLIYSSEDGSLNTTFDKRGSVASNRSEKYFPVKGTIELRITCVDSSVDVNVIKCRELQRNGLKTEDINAYVKVSISGAEESVPQQLLGAQRTNFQRTSVLYGKKEPEFRRHLKLNLPKVVTDEQMIHVSVWHRDKKYRRSEFLGCVSFPLKDAIKSEISGSFNLQSQSSKTPHGSFKEKEPFERRQKVFSLTEEAAAVGDIMATETEHVDGTGQGQDDGARDVDDKATGSESRVAILQREADEHLFLRYLELDPEIDASNTTPRKPNQAKSGRTPFTQTKKLTRTAAGGFGFTVIWTHPPRVERVSAGGPAERAGMKAGDYLVFVSGKNVVTVPERDVRELVKAAGQTLQLEVYRRSAQNGMLASSRQRLSSASHATVSEAAGSVSQRQMLTAGSGQIGNGSGNINTGSGLLGTEPPSGQSLRPGTACSGATTTLSMDAGASRRRLHLAQVTFSKEESPNLSAEQQRRKALLAIVAREQNYTSCLQFGMVRFVTALAEKPDIITLADHQLLFQNIEEILRLSEDILDQIIGEDGEIQLSNVVPVYLSKMPAFLSLYRKYCSGLKRADCVLVKKCRDSSGAFSRYCTTPPIPRRRPDVTSLVHKPLEQFRELFRLMRAALADLAQDGLEKRHLQVIVDQLQACYQEVTAGSGMMGLAGDGKPLLSVQDLESRLVFTRCKPFVLNTPGRQWIFGGELSKVDGRTIKPYWALLFSDMLLFATVSRDRVLFITEEPVILANVAETCFNVRKKVNEFHLTLGRNGGASPLVSCAPRSFGRKTTLSLRAPSVDLKAVWQSLLQRQIFRAHTMSGTPIGSPMDSPMDPAAAFALASLEPQRRQVSRLESTEASTVEIASRGRSSSRGSAIHLAQWMKQMPVNEETEIPESMDETWSVEELRKRSKELNLLDVAAIVEANNVAYVKNSPAKEKPIENDKSPSKSSNSGSQITVRTSPVVLDKIPICRQCHKQCMSKPSSPLASQKDQTSVSITDSLSPKPKPVPVILEKPKETSISSQCSLKKSPGFTDFRRSLVDVRNAPQAARRVIDSIEQSQKCLNKSYGFNENSPLLNRKFQKLNSPLSLEKQKEYLNSARSASASSSSRNSPLSTSHTTCSSQVFNSSGTDLRTTPVHNTPGSIKCVIAQEKYISEVKHVESFYLPKNSPDTLRRDKATRQKAETVLSQIFGVNIVSKTDNGCGQNKDKISSSHTYSTSKVERSLGRHTDVINVHHPYKGKNIEELASDDDLLMLMGFSAINPAAHLCKIDPFKTKTDQSCKLPPDNLPPDISINPPTPDYKLTPRNSEELVDDSPDSPQSEDLPYVNLKRYGTLSSLERMPSDETDDGNVKIAPINDKATKMFSSEVSESADYIGGGLMSWTARAGSFVAEKMSLFNSYSEHTTTGFPKQPSFLERYLGVGDWRYDQKDEGTVVAGGFEGGEGSGASGEEAWGTPSSGELSDNAFSDHGTLSSPTKSSSSYAGDDDTELMMDELLMAPTITGPSLRPLLPRRRLEPLMEEEYSDSEGGGEEEKETFSNTNQGREIYGPASDGRADADGYCSDAHKSTTPLAHPASERRGTIEVVGEAVSPERTPTNEQTTLQNFLGVCEHSPRARALEHRRSSLSSTASSATSTLEQTAIHTTPPPEVASSAAKESVGMTDCAEKELRLSPRAEMRLALDQGKDMLADQDENWGGNVGPWSWRAACQRALLRRVASADAVSLFPQRDTTSNSSAYAWRESDKTLEMEHLAQAEVQRTHLRRQTICQSNGKILGFLRRRASSASPERRLLTDQRPFSPRKQNVSSKQGYYKICFVNGSL